MWPQAKLRGTQGACNVQNTAQKKLETFCDLLSRCNTLEDLHGFIADIRTLFEVEHAVYHAANRHGEPFAIVTYSNEWANYYANEQLYNVDPVVLNGFQRFQPYDWKSLSWQAKPARTMLLDAIAGGVGNQGISIPIRGPSGELALFSLSHKSTDRYWLRYCETYLQMLLLAAHYLHQRARVIEFQGEQTLPTTLSPRERDALSYLGAGKSRAQTAEILRISEHTLRVYIESARYKLGAANTVNAVARAVSQGLVVI